MQWSITVLIWRFLTGSQHHRAGVCSNTNFVVLQCIQTQGHHYWSPLCCPSHPLLFVSYCFLQLKFWARWLQKALHFSIPLRLQRFTALEVWLTFFSLTPSSAVFQVTGEVLISHSLSFQHQLNFLFFILLLLPWDMQLVSEIKVTICSNYWGKICPCNYPNCMCNHMNHVHRWTIQPQLVLCGCIFEQAILKIQASRWSLFLLLCLFVPFFKTPFSNCQPISPTQGSHISALLPLYFASCYSIESVIQMKQRAGKSGKETQKQRC